MKNWGLYLLLIIFISLSSLYLYTNYELKEYQTTEYIPASQEALNNPYLASKLFLENLNHEVAYSTLPVEFKDTDTSNIVIISDIEKLLNSSKRINESLKWIHNGGHLIVGNNTSNSGDTHRLLDYFDINIVKATPKQKSNTSQSLEEFNKLLKENANQLESNEHIHDDNIKETPPLYLNFIDGKKFEIESSSLIYLKHDFINLDKNASNNNDTFDKITDINIASYFDLHKPLPNLNQQYMVNTYATINDSIGLIKINYGMGSLTVIPDITIWNNYRIDHGDHAWLLAWILDDTKTTLFYYNFFAPSLLSIIYQYFPETFIAAFVLLLLWLWNKAIRTSHLYTRQTQHPSQLSKHLLASAKYLTKNHQYQPLLTPIVEDITQIMRITHPKFHHLKIDENARLLSHHSNIEQNEIKNWYLKIEQINSKDQFIDAIKFGHKLRKKL